MDTQTKNPKHVPLIAYYSKDPNTFDIGIDEAGRGPLLGRVYAAAVVLPKDDSFDTTRVKDSKKFHSLKKIQEAAAYVKEHALTWHVAFVDEKTIDQINILQATQQAMHECIHNVRKKMSETNAAEAALHLMVDGNYFQPVTHFNKATQKMEVAPYTCVEGGDGKYACIAAASILAKVERDQYIFELCAEHPDLIEKYRLDKNKGYGTKQHCQGLLLYGPTPWHRMTFAKVDTTKKNISKADWIPVVLLEDEDEE